VSTQTKIENVSIRGDTARVTISTHGRSFLIPTTLAEQWGLKPQVVLTDSQVSAIEDESERFACHRQAAGYLASRDHSESELGMRLRKKGFKREHVDDVLSAFRRQGLIDDTRVATNLASALLRRKPCWRGYLLSCLNDKGIDRATAELAAEAVFTGQDETELACCALRPRMREYSQFQLETARRKAYNYLSRRGFSFQAARQAWEILNTRSDENEDSSH
jgi:regulatory protein